VSLTAQVASQSDQLYAVKIRVLGDEISWETNDPPSLDFGRVLLVSMFKTQEF
jgi:hypothetical protein